MDTITMGLKENLKRLRTAKGWTQAEVAEKANVPFRSYQNWEVGIREPRLDALPRLARAFGVTLDELLAGQGESEAKPDNPPANGKGKPKK